MKVVIVGLPYFASRISRDIQEVDRANTYLAVDPARSIWQKVRFIWHIISASVLYQIGGHTRSGKVLKIASFLNVKIVMHWCGTDVLNARKAYSEDLMDSALLGRTTHLCNADWLQKELAQIGIAATLVPITGFPTDIPEPPPLPKKFSILSYLGKGREKFYGVDKLVELARSFPDIPIRVAGISTYSESLPQNIFLLGWVRDMDKEYQDCVLCLRLPEHDGLSHSVLEALSHGRYVGYVYDFPCTNHVVSAADIHELVRSLSERHGAGVLEVNSAGFRHISENHKRVDVMRCLAMALKDAGVKIADKGKI